MAEKSLGDNSDSAVAYVMCKFVIDHTKVTLDELIYLVSEALTKRPLTHFIERDVLVNNVKSKKRFKVDTTGQPILIDKSGQNSEANWQEWLLDEAILQEEPRPHSTTWRLTSKISFEFGKSKSKIENNNSLLPSIQGGHFYPEAPPKAPSAPPPTRFVSPPSPRNKPQHYSTGCIT